MAAFLITTELGKSSYSPVQEMSWLYIMKICIKIIKMNSVELRTSSALMSQNESHKLQKRANKYNSFTMKL